MKKGTREKNDVVTKLRKIDAQTAKGLSLAEALQGTGISEAAYAELRSAFDGLLRTLGPSPAPNPKASKRTRRSPPAGGDKPTR